MESAPYHSIRDKIIAAGDSVFAEPLRIAPQKAGAADPDRAAVEINAVLRTAGGKPAAVSVGRDRDWEMKQAGQKAFLAINRTTYPDIVIKRGDKVRALSRPGKPWFEILYIDDRGHRRLIAHLGEV